MNDDINTRPVSLGELQTELQNLPQDLVFPIGFTNPHSWRGVYMYPAVEPARDVPVAEMLAAVDRLLTETFVGWKGGDYTFSPYDDLYIDHEGESGGPRLVWFLWQMLVEQAQQAA